jgi:hypothetical protein
MPYAAAAWLNSTTVVQHGDSTQRRGLENLLASSQVAESHGPLERLESPFRIGHSFRLQAPPKNLQDPLAQPGALGDMEVTPRNCHLWCTGQRDLIWKAGFQVVEQHWLAGIGFGAWKTVLQEKLGFPFDHPHSGLLEVWGEFGILGFAMYMTFIVLLFVRARYALSANVTGFKKWLLVAISMTAIAFLGNELVDDTKFFSISPHAIWIWPLLALQERYLDKRLIWSVLAPFLSLLSGRFKNLRVAGALIARGNR